MLDIKLKLDVIHMANANNSSLTTKSHGGGGYGAGKQVWTIIFHRVLLPSPAASPLNSII